MTSHASTEPRSPVHPVTESPRSTAPKPFTARWCKHLEAAGVTRLGDTSTALEFREWRDAVERWARNNEGTMAALSPREVADAAAHFLAQPLRERLRIRGELESSWSDLLECLRYLHRHSSASALRQLEALAQGQQETLADFFCRFEELRAEAEVPGP
jgi:hypothetical protein